MRERSVHEWVYAVSREKTVVIDNDGGLGVVRRRNARIANEYNR
jgi:hypothetical protein